MGTVIFWIVVGFLLSNLAFYAFMIIYASHRIYVLTLKRQSGAHWGREVSSQDPTQLEMDAIGMAWQREHDAARHDVHIFHNNANLYGEYYDFGSDKAVIILSGRTESLRYGYYFSKPYADAGLNVLVVDPRSHGLSDGTFNTVGFEESKDALAWARFLHDTHHVKSIVFHGICIGAAAGMLGITADDCPEYVVGLVTEGMFSRFAESMKNHLIERKKHFPLLLSAIDAWMKHYTGHSMMNGPINVIHRMNKPLLMIQSKMDPYSTPQNAKLLYELCPSEEKKIVWYEQGGHSLLRLTDTDTYDCEIKLFLERVFQPALSQ